MPRKKFATQVDTDILTAIRAIAQEEGRQIQAMPARPTLALGRSSAPLARRSFPCPTPAVSKGIALNMIQKWLGHAHLSTTSIYANAVGGKEQNNALRMW